MRRTGQILDTNEDTAMPFEIEGHGWELHVKRLWGLSSTTPWSPSGPMVPIRCSLKAEPVASLSGHICERTGAGDNTAHGEENDLRIREGRYALSTQFGPHYRSVGYTDDATHPMPGFALLLGTAVRTGILVHPGRPLDTISIQHWMLQSDQAAQGRPVHVFR